MLNRCLHPCGCLFACVCFPFILWCSHFEIAQRVYLQKKNNVHCRYLLLPTAKPDPKSKPEDDDEEPKEEKKKPEPKAGGLTTLTTATGITAGKALEPTGVS